MRLAHLHIQDLITYSHSLRLQNAILERHFKHEDWLRSSPESAQDSVATRRQDNDSAGTNDSHVSRAHKGDEARHERPTPQGAHPDPHLISDRTSGVTMLQASDAYTGRHRPRASALVAQNGRCPMPSMSKVGRSLSSTNFQENRATPPDPVLLTFSTPPTYTVGRRHLLANPISPDQQSFLSANGLATFHASPRGGLLTYHAPGQVTGYVITDLRRHGITARCWVRLLEDSIIRTCGAWGVRTGRTNDPGVWVLNAEKESVQVETQTVDHNSIPAQEPNPTDRKICAIGVQVSRGITSHGIGLNVYDAPLDPLSSSHSQPETGNFNFSPAQLSSPSYDAASQGYLSWGFSRIVACGLEGKSVSWLTREISPSAPPSIPPTEGSVAAILAREIMSGINAMKGVDKETVDGIYEIDESDVLG